METAVLINARNVQETLIADPKRDVQDTPAYPRGHPVIVAVQGELGGPGGPWQTVVENDLRRSSFDLNDVMNQLKF